MQVPKSVHRIVPALILVTLWLSLARQSADDQILFDVKYGQWILRHHTLPSQAAFCHTWPDQPTPYPRWLSQLISGLFYHWLGAYGPGLLQLLLVGLIYLLLYLVQRRQPLVSLAVLLGMSVLLELLQWPLQGRHLFCLLTLLTLQLASSKPAILWSLPLVQLLWVNSDPGFWIGPALLGFWLVTQGRRNGSWQTGVRVLGVSLALMLLNPTGWHAWCYPWQAYQAGTLFSCSSKGLFTGLGAMLFLLLLSLVLWRWSSATGSKELLVLVTATSALGAYGYEWAGALGLLTATLLVLSASAQYTAQRDRFRRLPWLAATLLLLTGLWTVACVGNWLHPSNIRIRYGLGLNRWALPLRAIRFLQQSGLRGALYNDPSFAGAALWSNQRIAIDARPCAYPQNYRENIRTLSRQPSQFPAFARRYHLSQVFLRPAAPGSRRLLPFLVKHFRWQLVYCDEQAAILIQRQPQHAALIEKFALDEGDWEKWLQRTEKTLGPVGYPRDRGLQASLLFQLAQNLAWAGLSSDAVKVVQFVLALAPQMQRAKLLAADLAFAQHRISQGLQKLEQAQRQNPTDEKVLLRLAQKYLQLGTRYARDKAQGLLQQVLQTNPHSSQARYFLARLAIDRNELAQARQLLDEILAHDPHNAPARQLRSELKQRLAFKVMQRCYLAGQQLARQGRHRQALEQFNRALEVCDQYEQVFLAKGDSLMALQRYQAAAQAYAAALALKPQQTNISMRLARALLKNGKWRQALQLVHPILKQDPYHPQAKKILAQVDQQAIAELTKIREQQPLKPTQRALLAYAFSRCGRWEEALKVLRRAPQARLHGQMRAKLLFQWGQELLEQKKIRLAFAKLEAATAAWPQFVKAHQFLGELYMKREMWERAQEHFASISKLDPQASKKGLALVHLGQAQQFYLKHQYTQAVAQLEKYLQYEPDPANIALYRKILGNWKQQAQQARLQKARQLYQQGYQALRQQQWQAAVRQLAAAVRLDPHLPGLLFTLAQAYRQTQQWAAAIRCLQEVIKRQPQFAPAHLDLAGIYLYQRQYPKARQHYERYLQLAPQSPYAARVKQILASLKD